MVEGGGTVYEALGVSSMDGANTLYRRKGGFLPLGELLLKNVRLC
jgi:hypothetical protein